MLGSLLPRLALSTGRDGPGSALAARVGFAEDLDSLERALWVVVVAAVVLDVVTTYLGLAAGLSEGNPVMRRAMHEVGFGALAAGKLLVVAFAAWFRAVRPEYGTTVALGLALPWTATVLVNGVALTTV